MSEPSSYAELSGKAGHAVAKHNPCENLAIQSGTSPSLPPHVRPEALGSPEGCADPIHAWKIPSIDDMATELHPAFSSRAPSIVGTGGMRLFDPSVLGPEHRSSGTRG